MLGTNTNDVSVFNTPCRLFNEFMAGQILDDYDYTILATNFLYFRDGQNMYFQGLDKISGNAGVNVGKKRAYIIKRKGELSIWQRK